MPDLDLDSIRRELEARRDETRERVAALAKRPERGTAQGFGKRIGDGTVEAISRLTDIGVGTSLETTLERTERALAKLDDGTYGLCDACGEPIAPKRLQAHARRRAVPRLRYQTSPSRQSQVSSAARSSSTATGSTNTAPSSSAVRTMPSA